MHLHLVEYPEPRLWELVREGAAALGEPQVSAQRESVERLALGVVLVPEKEALMEGPQVSAQRESVERLALGVVLVPEKEALMEGPQASAQRESVERLALGVVQVPDGVMLMEEPRPGPLLVPIVRKSLPAPACRHDAFPHNHPRRKVTGVRV